MKLSIIIPHYNSPQKLKRLLESIFNDTHECQIVVVDDTSTEDLDILENVKKEYSGSVEFYCNETGYKGAGAARNEGIKHIKGNWLMFADADDYFMTGWYEAVSEYFNKTFDIVFFMPTSISESTGEVAKRHIRVTSLVNDYLKNGKYSDLAIRYNHIVPWAKLIRTEVVVNNYISFENVMYSNDVLFSAKTGFYANDIAADSHIIYSVTDSQGTLTKAVDEKALLLRFEEYGKENLFLRQHLTKPEYDIIKHRLGNFSRIFQAIKRKCGFNLFSKYVSIYRRYKIPFGALLVHVWVNNFGSFIRKMKAH